MSLTQQYTDAFNTSGAMPVTGWTTVHMHGSNNGNPQVTSGYFDQIDQANASAQAWRPSSVGDILDGEVQMKGVSGYPSVHLRSPATDVNYGGSAGYAAALYDSSGVYLFKLTDNSVLGSYAGDFRGKLIKLTCYGSAIKLYADGTQRVSVTDTSTTATGKSIISSYSGRARLDDYTVWESVTDVTGQFLTTNKGIL